MLNSTSFIWLVNKPGAINVKMNGSVLGCWSWLYLPNWIWALTLSLLLKRPPRNLEPLIHSMKFHSPEVALYLYKFTIQPCREYCCHVWAGTPHYYMELLDKLKNRYPGLNVVNVASLSLLYGYYFCSFKLAELVPLPHSCWRSTCYSDRLHDSSVTILRCYKDVYVNSFFLHTVRLWNSLPIECFPLTYDLSGCKSRINRHLLTVGSF